MKFYIFVTHTMCGVGGGQRYVQSKARWLKGNDWHVVVCHVSRGKVILDVSGIRLVDIPELRTRPRCISKKRLETLIGSLIPEFHNDDVVYVESSSLYLGIWGELIAAHYHARHLCYVLEENPASDDKGFLQFKDKRHELAFIEEPIASRVLEESSSEECEGKVLVAYNPSPIVDVPCRELLKDCDFTVGCISRLEKAFIAPMVIEIAKFCENNPDIILRLVFVGEGPDPIYRSRIESLGHGLDNLRIVFLGFLSPIPLSLVNSFDLCISKSGAATITSQIGLPTIRYSLDKDILLGFDCWAKVDDAWVLNSNLYGEKDLSGLLRRVFVEDGLREARENTGQSDREEPNYSLHLSYIPKQNTYEYYDCLHSYFNWKHVLTACWVRLFHSADYDKLLAVVRGSNG